MTTIKYCTKEHPLPDGRLVLLGAVDDVTPTMNLIEMGSASLLVDCSIDRDASDLPDEALEAQAVLLTHAHNDHVSALPKLLAGGFGGPIYATPATLEVTKAILRDGIRLNGGSSDDVRSFMAVFDYLAKPRRYDEPFKPIKNEDITAVFKEAGHILGSASIDLRSPLSRVILSGDLGRPNSPILRDYNTKWDDDRPVDLVLVETTYGDRVHDVGTKELEQQLEQAINHALADGGHILVPAFAIGRTQNLLYLLNSLVESGRVKDLPVAVDTPLGLKITNTYKHYRRIYDKEALQKISHGDDPLDFDQLFSVKRGKDSVKLRDVKESMLIIAGSGMCTGGRIVGHLKELLPKPETDVLFVGHQARRTPGRAIQDKAKRNSGTETVWLQGEEIALRAQVDTLHGISAHADKNELAAWLKAIPNVKKVALHHGEKESQESFAGWWAYQG